MIELCKLDQLDAFYDEAKVLLENLLAERNISLADGLLGETIELNKALLKRPFQVEDELISLEYNILDFYEDAIIGIDTPIETAPATYFIDKTTHTWDTWDDWCQKVVWYGNKKGAYLYPIQRHHQEIQDNTTFQETGIAGHY